jgi:hypothetical protein
MNNLVDIDITLFTFAVIAVRNILVAEPEPKSKIRIQLVTLSRFTQAAMVILSALETTPVGNATY